MVYCSEYNEYYSPKQLGEIGTRLVRGLRENGQFSVDCMHNPEWPIQVTQKLQSALRGLDPGDIFLFWFVGHGVPNQQHTDLHLLLSDSSNNTGLNVYNIAEELKNHLNVTKVVVLDCCHTALGGDQLVQCEKHFFWPTAGRLDTAPAKERCGILETQTERGTTNFTAEVANLLNFGIEDAIENELTCKMVFEKAAEFSPFQHSGLRHSVGDVPIAFNAARPPESLDRILKSVANSEIL